MSDFAGLFLIVSVLGFTAAMIIIEDRRVNADRKQS